ncbi:MAG TPA: DUF4082 domain-containing protein [Thermoanaerobaculia bacterium]|nr:DUF4082 domain-containing protein [Thermoanaerobaculia bacterium]
MSLKTTTFRFAAFALMAAAAWPASAYRMFQAPNTAVACDSNNGFVHWPSTVGTFNWYHNTGGQGSGKASALQAAMATWTNASQSDHVLNYAGTTGNGLNLSDSQNTLVWADTSTSLCSVNACHAITVMDLSGQVLQEVDIVFNELMDWRTDGTHTSNCPDTAAGTPLDTQAIATHELGHSLGLGHLPSSDPAFATATMGGSSCNTAGRSLATDDLNGLQCVTNRYPVGPAYEGYLETANCRTISGWVWNSDSPNDPVYLELKRNSTLYDIVLADQYRADLFAAGKGDGEHGFSRNTAVAFKTGTWQTVSLKYTGGTNGDISGSPKAIICRLYLFPESWSPDQENDTGGVYEVGTQFGTTDSGYITHLGFYWALGETGSHTATLWSNTGVSLGTVPLSAPGFGQGWTYGTLSTPVAITAGTLYRVSVNTNTKQAKSPCSPSSPTSLYNSFTNSPLIAYQGFWKAGTGFPTTSSCSNFFVSVRFDI